MTTHHNFSSFRVGKSSAVQMSGIRPVYTERAPPTPPLYRFAFISLI